MCASRCTCFTSIASLVRVALKAVRQMPPTRRMWSPAQSTSSRRGGSFLRQLSMPEHGAAAADADAAGLETVMWTRELAKRLLLPRADLEGLEALLDTYFMLVRALSAGLQATKDMSSMTLQVGRRLMQVLCHDVVPSFGMWRAWAIFPSILLWQCVTMQCESTP